MSEKKRNWIVRLAPCAWDDIEAAESWLEDMASSGLYLRPENVIGPTLFYRGEPGIWTFRLEALPPPKSFWKDDGSDPVETAMEEYAPDGWEYAARRGSFLVLRRRGAVNRGRDINPASRAQAIDRLRRAERKSAITSIILALVQAAITLYGKLFTMALEFGVWFVLAVVIVLPVVYFVSSIVRIARLGRLRRKLLREEPLDDKKDWRRGAPWHFLSRVLIAALVLSAIFSFVRGLLFRAEAEPLESFTGELPFPRLSELLPPGDYDLHNLQGYNTVKIESSFTAPVRIELWEDGGTRLPNGRVVSGTLIVFYAELASPILARMIAEEYIAFDTRWGRTDVVELDIPGVEFCRMYTDVFSAIVMQDGRRMIRIRHFGDVAEQILSPEELAALYADALFR